MRGLSGPPRAPTNSGPSGPGRVGAEPQIVGDRRRDATGRTGTIRSLPPLPMHAERLAAAGGASPRRDAQRLGDAQAGAVEQGEDGGVSCRDPRLRRRGALSTADDVARRRRREGLGQGASCAAAAGSRGTRRRWRAPPSRGSGSASGCRRCRGPGCASPRRRSARGHEGADVGRSPAPATSASLGGPPRCSVRKDRNCVDVAGVGLDAFRREPPLAGEMPPPARTAARSGAVVTSGAVMDGKGRAMPSLPPDHVNARLSRLGARYTCRISARCHLPK